MARLLGVIAVAAAVCAGCGANTATQERQSDPPKQAERVAEAPIAVPDNPVDRGIWRDLGLAIARDADLHKRVIRFSVTNGDVSVTGIVRTEEERTRINDLAMAIDGVKSVANALQVAE
jgi:osmotically-inducible protein OsmY